MRDAAAYVCWAFARAYAPEVLLDGVHLLASSLLTIACYDREVNCRCVRVWMGGGRRVHATPQRGQLQVRACVRVWGHRLC